MTNSGWSTLLFCNADPIKFDTQYEIEEWKTKKPSLLETHCKLCNTLMKAPTIILTLISTVLFFSI